MGESIRWARAAVCLRGWLRRVGRLMPIGPDREPATRSVRP
ncbi:hypothetical protein [Streptomyces sp. NPDC047315]